MHVIIEGEMTMPKDKQLNKVLVIGSGPIVIGQAAEFDYAGTQACLTLKEAGCHVVLMNNNPATVMTDEDVADHVYFEPLTVTNVEKVIQKEKPDGIMLSVSGQTGLNLAFALAEKDMFTSYGVEVLGTPIEAIKRGEDREAFKQLMEEIKEPTPESTIVQSSDAAKIFADAVGYPIIVRPAYTLGGSGGGIAHDEESFIQLVRKGIRASPIHQCLIEKSIAGWKEIEYEVIRDKKNQTNIVCHMENIDPVGVHTGDSIVVAPIQTLADNDIERLRQASIKIVNEIGIIGACNVQLAFHPETKEYVVIEINPRVSRSSALASKATGYPIAKIATKLSLGYTLDELNYERVGETLATFEPIFDYVIVKFPCWPFDKLKTADRTLGTQMKATGEVMAIEKTLPAALQKAIRSLGISLDGIYRNSLKGLNKEELRTICQQVDDRRLFAIFALLEQGASRDEIYDLTGITEAFLDVFQTLVTYDAAIKATTLETVDAASLLTYKQAGFTNGFLTEKWQVTREQLDAKLRANHLYPAYKKVHAYAEKADQDAAYYYKVWQTEEAEPASNGKRKVLVIGSGPIKIGQGMEFDYCSVQGVKSLQKLGVETVLLNNNPATVSTDYEVADRLYFEPVTADDVLQIMHYEQIDDVIIQFGGQTAIDLIEPLEAAGVQFFGSSMQTIDTLEDRESFYAYLQSIDVAHIPGEIAENEKELMEKAQSMAYPILVRPSYVIGGQGMVIIRSDEELTNYVKDAAFPILLDAYYPGKEVEVDAVTDGDHIFVPAIFEHIEKAGVHSGDSMAVTPPITLSETMKEQIIDYTEKIARGIDFKGVFNIQFVIYEDVVYVLEVNPRASRTVPLVSKVTGAHVIDFAVRALLGEKLNGNVKVLKENEFYTVKAPVFSTTKLPGVDPAVVPEMKSTGELIGVGDTLQASLTKAFLWNEQLQTDSLRQKREIYIIGDVQQVRNFSKIKKGLDAAGIRVRVDADFADGEELDAWLSSDLAYAVFAADDAEAVRVRALELGLIVMSAEETLAAFAQVVDEDLPVIAMEAREKAYQKEVVYS